MARLARPPLDAFRAALAGDAIALRAFELARSWADWECHPYFSMRTLVCCLRPRRGDAGWLDREDGRLTPDQFADLAFEAAVTDQSIQASLRRYLTLLRDGRGREALLMIGEADHEPQD